MARYSWQLMHIYSRVLIAGLLSASIAASASGNIKLFNGQRRDADPPSHFTGEVTYRDLASNKITSREQQVDGVREGPYIEYDERTGKVTDSGTYRQGKYHGVRRHFGTDGVIQQEYAYEDGKLVGVQKSFKDGVLQRVYLMVRGQPLPGVDFQLNKTGQLTMIRCGLHSTSAQDAAWCGHNGKQSTVSLYFDDGELRETVQYLWGKQHGLVRKYDKKGQVRSEEKYVHGTTERDGERVFNKDGDLLFKGDCDGARVSCTETAFFEGPGKEVKTVSVFKKGQLEKRTVKYQNGKVLETMRIEGARVFIDTFDDEGGKESSGVYTQAKTWSWRQYVPDGRIEHFAKGKVYLRESYKEGVREGLTEHFWEQEGQRVREEAAYVNDKLTKQKIFVDDKLGGELEYLPDGSLKSRKVTSLPKGVEI